MSPRSCCQPSVRQCLIPAEGKKTYRTKHRAVLTDGAFAHCHPPPSSQCQTLLPPPGCLLGEREDGHRRKCLIYSRPELWILHCFLMMSPCSLHSHHLLPWTKMTEEATMMFILGMGGWRRVVKLVGLPVFEYTWKLKAFYGRSCPVAPCGPISLFWFVCIAKIWEWPISR